MPIIGITKPIYVLETLVYNSVYICTVDALLTKFIKYIVKEFKNI
jgi:hypothetical protein